MTVTHPVIAPDGSQAMVDGVTTEGGGVTTIITSTTSIDPEADAEVRLQKLQKLQPIDPFLTYL